MREILEMSSGVQTEVRSQENIKSQLPSSREDPGAGSEKVKAESGARESRVKFKTNEANVNSEPLCLF